MEHLCPIHSLPDELLIKILWHSSSNQQQSTSTCNSDSDALWALLTPEPRYIYADPSVDKPIQPIFDYDYRDDDKIPLQTLPTPILADAARNLLIASVCRRWRRIARRYVTTLFVRKSIVVSYQDLSNAVTCFANLTHLHLSDSCVETLDDGFFTHLATSCGSKLTALHIGRRITHTLGKYPPHSDSRVDLHPVSESGLDHFFRRCSQLQQLSLYCLHPDAKLPASFFHLTALHTLVLTDASALEAPDLANLTSLTTLLIASLKLTCEQLSSLVYLRSLTSISISQVTQVDHSAALPIAQLSKLKSLEFAGCCPDLFPSGEPSSSVERLLISQFKDVDLPDDIAQLLPRLRELSIRECDRFSELPEDFTSLSNLETLIISTCEYFRSLPENFGQLPVLKTLVLDGLHIRNCPIRKLPASFTALSSLQILTIEHCYELASIAGSLNSLKRLKQLDLIGCPMLTEPPDFLPRSLEVLSLELPHRVPSLPDLSVLLNLRRLTLKLEGTGQGAAGTTTISSSSSSSSISSSPHLKHLENVEYLDLSIGEAVERFPFPRFPFPQLRFLKISFAKLIQKLPSDLGCDLRQLRQLRLHITKGLIELPETITLLRHLTSLDVEWASQLASLPDGMGALSRLRRLRLCHCSVLQHLPASLTRLSCFHELNAEETCIRALPPGIAQLTRLRCLNLGECKQLQVLPEGLTDLKMLRFLGVKGSETAIDSVSKEQERGFNRMYDLRTDVAGE